MVLQPFMGSGYPLEVTYPHARCYIPVLGLEPSAVWSLLWWPARHS